MSALDLSFLISWGPVFLSALFLASAWTLKSFYGELKFSEFGSDIMMSAVALHTGFFASHISNLQTLTPDSSMFYIIFLILLFVLWQITHLCAKSCKENEERARRQKIIGIISLIIGMMVIATEIFLLKTGAYA